MKRNLIKGYILFLIGLFIASMGVAFSTKAGLGTSIQTALAFVYGYLTNFSCFLIRNLNAGTYRVQLLYMILSCFILAFGIWLQVQGNVAMLPGEAMNRAISQVTGKRYENVKIFFDIFYIAISATLSLVFLGGLKGVREGSIIAAIAVGSIIKLYEAIFQKGR